MLLRKNYAGITVIEAVDNLSHMAELDRFAQEDAGLTEEQRSERMQAASWRDPEHAAFNRERVKETFRVIFKYLKELYEKDKGIFREEKTQRAIQAMMLLATEAAQKVDEYTQMFKAESDGSTVMALKEFKELQQFYLTKIARHYQSMVEIEEKWAEEWGQGEELGELATLEAVQRDRDYELFFIKKEDGTPYFNRELLRHMHLVAEFETLLKDPSMEDPFLRLEVLADRDAYMAAKEILQVATAYIDDYFKEAMKFKRIGFVSAISKALMALMLAANQRNLMQTALGKSAMHYYRDFHEYLRSAFRTPEYQKCLTSGVGSSEKFLHSAVNLSHVLCSCLFLYIGSKKEMISLIHQLIEKGEEGSQVQTEKKSPLSLWNQLRDQDRAMRNFLKDCPNGPLAKTMKLLNTDRPMTGFDPIANEQQVAQLYTISGGDMHISCVRLPCPTSQERIFNAEVVAEFEGFLRALGSPSRNQRHLMINVQDRTSWKEHARCSAVEVLQDRGEFSRSFVAVTLPKNTDFYHQSGIYIEWDDAAEFIKLIKEQVAGGEQCGFFFPKDSDHAELLDFVDRAVKMIHVVFFGGKERLMHKNRLDFIEIFYLLLSLKWIEKCHPDTLSFSCKDGVDTGACSSAELFVFLRMMNDFSAWSKQESDFLLWMVYSSGLIVRGRVVDSKRLDRMINALSLISAQLEAHRGEVVAAASKLYQFAFFKDMTVKEVAFV